MIEAKSKIILLEFSPLYWTLRDQINNFTLFFYGAEDDQFGAVTPRFIPFVTYLKFAHSVILNTSISMVIYKIYHCILYHHARLVIYMDHSSTYNMIKKCLWI